MDTTSRFSYPVFLDLQGVLVLVVGGGRVAARKASGLIAARAAVRLVATHVSPHVDRRALSEVIERPFDPVDLDHVRLAVTATGDAATDATVSAHAQQRGIWVNAADQPRDCEFILPAITRAGRVTAAISTGGASPALARELRNIVAPLLTDSMAALAEELAGERAAVKARGESTEDIDWTPRVRAGIEAAGAIHHHPG